jgi:diguanylate cyclase (GGDEF)-like protein
LLSRLCGLFCLSLTAAAAAAADDARQMLKQADENRLADYAQFSTLLQSLEASSGSLSKPDREYLEYLQGYNSAYTGHYEDAIATLGKIVATAEDVMLRFRAATTIVNVLTVSRRYEEAFTRLNRLLEQLPQVTDKAARQQALLVAALTYVEVGQYDLTLSYAQMIIDENWADAGLCKGGLLKLEALYGSHRLTRVAPELQGGIGACEASHELTFANTIRTYAAKIYIEGNHYDEAIALLKQHYAEVEASRYGRLISAYDALLAQAYHQKGMPALARQFGLDTIHHSPPHEYTEPLVSAYGVLYELARDEGDFKSALAFHEQFAVADKGYLDDVSARHLAYQKVSHENIANKLQVDALKSENRVLQLEKQLTAKAVETGRLYIALLILIALFIGLWAYRTKRSQLHFMQLSRLDGLTGISNRLHFIGEAQRALEGGGKAREPLCIALCDLDHFKSINDRHGHATGDYVLKRVVAVCKSLLGPNDIFGRFGGEEFAFVFPGCGAPEARRRSEELRQAIAAISTKQEGVDLTVSASFGIASTISSGFDLRQLLARADSALYDAKRTGRNRVVLDERSLGDDLPAGRDDHTGEMPATNRKQRGPASQAR